MKQRNKKVRSPVAKYMNQYCKPSSVPSKKHARGDRFGKYKKGTLQRWIEEEEEEEDLIDPLAYPKGQDSHDQAGRHPHNEE